MTTMASDLISHIESHLGAIDGAWSETADADPLVTKILRFRGVPDTELSTVTTLGLSDRELAMPSGRTVRQELMMCAMHRDEEHLPGLVGAVAEDLVNSGRALARGEVVGPAGPLCDGTGLTAIYAAPPVFFPVGLQVFRASTPPTIFVLLLPITDDESTFIAGQGWEAFEELLESTDVDLFDFRRGTSLRHMR